MTEVVHIFMRMMLAWLVRSVMLIFVRSRGIVLANVQGRSVDDGKLFSLPYVPLVSVFG